MPAGVCQSSSYCCAEFRIRRNDEVDIVQITEGLENRMGLGNGSQIADKYNFMYVLVADGKDGRHADGLENHVENT